MPHFFISSKDVNNGRVAISDKENYRHIAKSLRIRKGEKLLLIDENKIQYETVVENVTTDEVLVKIENSYKSDRSLDFGLYLAQSPLRSDAQSFVVEKAAELGVKGLYPVHTDNCALSPEIIKKKIDKWQKIMYEASKQCERADVPVCFQPETLENLIEKLIAEQDFDPFESALKLARKRRIGPFSASEKVRKERRSKDLAILGRAGFDYDVAVKVLESQV